MPGLDRRFDALVIGSGVAGSIAVALTIMALTARACEYIAREHATGALREEAAA
jgi:hypothetical protein